MVIPEKLKRLLTGKTIKSLDWRYTLTWDIWEIEIIYKDGTILELSDNGDYTLRVKQW